MQRGAVLPMTFFEIFRTEKGHFGAPPGGGPRGWGGPPGVPCAQIVKIFLQHIIVDLSCLGCLHDNKMRKNVHKFAQIFTRILHSYFFGIFWKNLCFSRLKKVLLKTLSKGSKSLQNFRFFGGSDFLKNWAFYGLKSAKWPNFWKKHDFWQN